MSELIPVTPTCRYGHGNLVRVTSNGEDKYWGYVSMINFGKGFGGELYVCKKCGYTELFDNDFLATLKTEGAE